MIGRQRINWRVCGLIVLAAAQRVSGAESGKVAWHTDAGQAWKMTQQQGRPLLVFVTHEHCAPCRKMKEITYTDRGVASTINNSFVALALDGAVDSTLLKDLGVTAYPTTFVISPQAIVLDRIDGYVPAATLASRLAAAKTEKLAGKLAGNP